MLNIYNFSQTANNLEMTLNKNWIFHIRPKNQKLSSNHEKEEIQP